MAKLITMPFFHTHISSNALQRVREVLLSGWVSEGKLVKEFEDKINQFLNCKFSVALNSCTSALHLALGLAGVTQGDEVILPPQTFVATGLAILMQGGVPIFSDIQYETGNICPHSIRKKVTERTKAIIAVHWGGYPCDIDEINRIAEEHDIPVIEDAAHAFGASYRGKSVGSISRFTAFSFQAIKHITTGDGGALCCLNKIDYDNARIRRWHGIDRNSSGPSILGEREYNIKTLGYKYHMNDYAAALGLGNIKDFPNNLKRIRGIANIYRKELINVPGLKLLNYNDDRESAYWLFTVLVKNRIGFIKKLKSHGIPTSVVHLRIDHNDIFGGITPNLFNQEKFNRHQVSIPIHIGLTDTDIKNVINCIRSGW